MQSRSNNSSATPAAPRAPESNNTATATPVRQPVLSGKRPAPPRPAVMLPPPQAPLPARFTEPRPFGITSTGTATHRDTHGGWVLESCLAPGLNPTCNAPQRMVYCCEYKVDTACPAQKSRTFTPQGQVFRYINAHKHPLPPPSGMPCFLLFFHYFILYFFFLFFCL